MTKYSFKKKKNKNLLLHAYKIKFMINKIKYNFKANYSLQFENFVKKILNLRQIFINNFF